MAKKVAKKRIKREKPAVALPFWPGLTRLHDKQVGCGAVLLTDVQARALVEAVEIAYMVLTETESDPGDEFLLDRMASAAKVLRWNYGMKERNDAGSK